MNKNTTLKTLEILKRDTQILVKKAIKNQIKFKTDAINWGDLRCVSAAYTLDDGGEEQYMVHIEECSPIAPKLQAYIKEHLLNKYGQVAVITEW